jgi:hypothetical protein
MKKIFLLLLFVLGFLLVPNTAMACKSKSMKHISHKKMASKNTKEQCCNSSSHSKNNNHNCGDGKCSHSKCVCNSSCSVFLFFSEVNTSTLTVETTVTMQQFPNFQTLLSSGYGSLWLLPKIS